MQPATLTGLAIGDALGMPFETHHFSSEALLDWDGTFQSGATNTLQPNLKPGQWTDDTKMASALAASLAASGTYDPVGAAQNYMEWYDSGDHRGMGKATREALERILKGYHWLDSGVDSQGNGTAMRVAPLGLFYYNSPGTAAIAARIDARITHSSEESVEGAVVVAVATALLVGGAQPNLDAGANDNFIRRVMYYTTYESDIISKLVDVQDILHGLPTEPRDRLKETLKALLEMGTGAHVVQTVPAALLCFLATSNFADAVEIAVRAGGDTDTTAAITGALAGTFYGMEQVQPYVNELEEAATILRLDKELYEMASAPGTP